MIKFIPNTDNRYSISDEGIVYSHYRYQKSNKRRYRESIVKIYIFNSSPAVSLNIMGRTKVIFVKTLMKELFNIDPPDDYHQYVLINKDKNLLKNSIENLEYRITLLSDYNYYPQPFYNKKGEIIHKICMRCGKKKDISGFQLQSSYKSKKLTYRNECTKCKVDNNWKRIKNNKSSYEKYIVTHNKWRNSEEGNQYYKNYNKNKYEKEKKELSRRFLSKRLHLHEYGIRESEIPDELVELLKKEYLLREKFKTM